VDKIDYFEKNLARQLAWIQAADTRLSLVLPLSTAMLGTLAVLAPAADNWPIGAAIFASFAVILLSLSIVFCACAAFPRTHGPKGSMIFFGGIAQREAEQYQHAAKSLSDEDYVDNLARQCRANAQIAAAKYTWVKRGLASLFLATLPWALSVYFLYAAE
jgi:hypothetical protein